MAHDHTERVRVRDRVERIEEPMHDDHAVTRTRSNAAVNTLFRLIYVIFGIFEVLLLIRFILKLGNANAANQVVAALYAVTEPLVRPFYGIFQQPEAGAMIEIAALLAIAFLVLVEALIAALHRAVTRP